MGSITQKNRRLFGNEINALAGINFVASFATAAVATIWALYINSFTHNNAITGFISSFLTLVSIISYFVFVPILEKTDRANLFSLSLFLVAISYLILSINKSFPIFMIVAIIMVSLYSLRISALGIMIKNKSKIEDIAKNEGIIFTFLNLGWVVAPLIAGFVADKYNIHAVFDMAAILILLSLVFFKKSQINDNHTKKQTDGNIKKNLIDFFKNKDRTISYIINGVAMSWWILIFLFLPLYMIENGLTGKHIGIAFFFISLPLIIGEYYFAKLVHKKGFKKMFIIGFLIVTICAFSAFFATNIYFILGFVVLASFGMAMLEPLLQAYFLSITNKSEVSRFYGPFSTSRDIFELAIKIIASVILLFLPFKSIFVFFGIIMFIMIFMSLRVRKVDSI